MSALVDESQGHAGRIAEARVLEVAQELTRNDQSTNANSW